MKPTSDERLAGIASRAATLIQAYDAQGHHRTAGSAEEPGARWLAGLAQATRAQVDLMPFPVSRVEPLACFLESVQSRIAGLPLFDGTFTDANGIRGTLALFGSDAEIGVIELPPMTATSPNDAFSRDRRTTRHRAIVIVTRGGAPGLAAINAPSSSSPYGPPTLQVASEHSTAVRRLAEERAAARVVVQVRRTEARAWNVTAQVPGTRSDVAPVLVMTPRSGWWACAGERGGGLVCWLEMLRTAVQAKLARAVWFVASSGHELGHLGLAQFLRAHPGIERTAHAWLHCGANIGAAQDEMLRLRASHPELERLAVDALTRVGRPPTQILSPTAPVLGEAHNIHAAGGRFISLIGGNRLFHLDSDRWPDAVTVESVARYASAFSDMLVQLGSA